MEHKHFLPRNTVAGVSDELVRGAGRWARIVACGGTAAAAIVFLAVGIGSVSVSHGVFSTGIGVMLLVYALVVAVVAWLAWRGAPFGNGLMVASALLHTLVGISVAHGSRRGWLWLFVLLALVTLVAAVKVRLDEVTAR